MVADVRQIVMTRCSTTDEEAPEIPSALSPCGKPFVNPLTLLTHVQGNCKTCKEILSDE